ncbi:MAG: hypothetical protein J6T57_01270 [Alphaproteobacteria bacterium]|nr:hypothetical protein [Alphaproteobacteria bacterium]
MKKVIFAICMLCAGAAFAANEESVTSREYVDAGLAAIQSTLTTTGTGAMTFDSSETDGLGQKPIYNPNGDYASQQNALVTASTANAAVQMAINGEFECIEWDPNDNTVCWLVRLKQYSPSKNLFDFENAQIFHGSQGAELTKVENGYTITRPQNGTARHIAMMEVGNTDNFLGKTITISAKVTGGHCTLYLYQTTANGEGILVYGQHSTYGTTPQRFTVTVNQKYADKLAIDIYIQSHVTTCTISDIMVEEGSIATAYEPYGHLYLPTGI